MFFFLIGSFTMLVNAQSAPAPPVPPPPPGFPIDNDLLILLAFGLLFGFYKIYVYTKKKKCSI